MRNQAIVAIPSDIRPASDNIFETFNKIRKAWVGKISDQRAAQLQALAPEVRFNLYAEIDDQVRAMYIDLLQRRRQAILENGGYHVIGYNDKKMLAHEFQYDTDELIIEAAEIVIASY